MSSDGIHLYEFCALICWKSNISVVWIKVKIFTTRQRSCRKVMFSQVSVILFRGGVYMPGSQVPSGGCVYQRWACMYTHHPQTWDLGDPPFPLWCTLTWYWSSGSHHNTCGWQAGSTHASYWNGFLSKMFILASICININVSFFTSLHIFL